MTIATRLAISMVLILIALTQYSGGHLLSRRGGDDGFPGGLLMSYINRQQAMSPLIQDDPRQRRYRQHDMDYYCKTEILSIKPMVLSNEEGRWKVIHSLGDQIIQSGSCISSSRPEAPRCNSCVCQQKTREHRILVQRLSGASPVRRHSTASPRPVLNASSGNRSTTVLEYSILGQPGSPEGRRVIRTTGERTFRPFVFNSACACHPSRA